jgi:hypothetical protein
MSPQKNPIEKSKNNFRALPLIVGLVLWLFPACGGLVAPGQGEGTLILNLPGAPAAERPVAGGRAALPVAALDGIRYSISCVGPTETKVVTAEGGGPITIGLAAGFWHISVEARYQDIPAGLGETDVEVRAEASNTANITMSPTKEFISIFPAISTSLSIVNAKTAEGGAYGIGEPFRYQVIANTVGDSYDISALAGPGDFIYDFSNTGTGVPVTIAPASFLNEIPLSSPPISVEVKSITDRVAWADSQGGAHTLLVYTDENISGITPPNANITNAAITIKSGDESAAGMRTLSLSGTGYMFSVLGAGAKLILDRNITIAGISGNTTALVVVDNSGELVMEEGSVITGNINTSSAGGGGVYVRPSSSFTMHGGTISGNGATGTSGLGGGVYIIGGTFAMNGGVIGGDTPAEKNTAASGGGVYVYSGATFTMGGSASISGNAATGIGGTDGGGGVYVTGTGASFAMSGSASIGGDTPAEKNTALRGGGVFVYDGNFTMNGSASVSGNEATGTGASDGGGGVYVYGIDASFAMGGSASVNGNTATQSGGGVIFHSTGTFTMGDSASINENRASGTLPADGGGGVYMDDGTFTMDGSASISGNTAFLSGGGVYVCGGTFTMNSVSAFISANQTTTGDGGGVYVGDYGYFGTFALTQGTVYGTDVPALQNTAAGNGDSVYKTNLGVCSGFSVILPDGLDRYENDTVP